MNLKAAVQRRLPRLLQVPLRAVYGQRPTARTERRGWADRRRVADLVELQLGSVVRAGPFAGLRLDSVEGDTPAKVLGCYELELHGAIEKLVVKQFGTIVNVGCAEGYYAVGMALRCPTAHIVAYDIDPAQQRLCMQNAVANAVASRLETRGECIAADLQALGEDALVIMDCEGCEDVLLQEGISATLLVELHDYVDKTLPDRVIKRLSKSHRLEIIHSVGRDSEAYPELDFLTATDRELALFERPTPMRWIIARPN